MIRVEVLTLADSLIRYNNAPKEAVEQFVENEPIKYATIVQLRVTG